MASDRLREYLEHQIEDITQYDSTLPHGSFDEGMVTMARATLRKLAALRESTAAGWPSKKEALKAVPRYHLQNPVRSAAYGDGLHEMYDYLTTLRTASTKGKPMTDSQIRQAIGLAYTYPENADKVMDTTLANAIVDAAHKVMGTAQAPTDKGCEGCDYAIKGMANLNEWQCATCTRLNVKRGDNYKHTPAPEQATEEGKCEACGKPTTTRDRGGLVLGHWCDGGTGSGEGDT